MRPAFNGVLMMTILFAAQVFARADLVKSSVLENDVAYFLVNGVEKNLPTEIQSAENELAVTNQITGTVLDLRFAGGEKFNSEKQMKNFFAQKKLPLAILVNDETSGAAIELAKNLRAAKVGLIFGSSSELTPDVSIFVNTNDEKKFLENPWATVSTNQIRHAGMTNFLPYVDHTTEADLVRARVKDDGESYENLEHDAARPKPFLRDPVLARGVDFVKGAAIMRQWHS